MNCRRGYSFIKGTATYFSRSLTRRCTEHNIHSTYVYFPLVTLNKCKSTFVAPDARDGGIFKKALKKIGWLKYSRWRLKRSGYYLYESVADGVNYLPFFKEFEMEDSFLSWFLITELHVWMLLVRIMAEADEGRFVRNNVVEAMWVDVSNRVKKLGDINSSVVNDHLKDLTEQFQAAIIGYDEGLLSDDTVLAGAIWRRFFKQKCSDPEKIECLVKYIRKQVKYLDELPPEKMLLSPSISWIPLDCIQEIEIQ